MRDRSGLYRTLMSYPVLIGVSVITLGLLMWLTAAGYMTP